MRYFWHLSSRIRVTERIWVSVFVNRLCGPSAALLRLLHAGLCLLPGVVQPVYSQSLPADTAFVFQLDSLPVQGFTLDKGWKWHSGDNPAWANPAFNDHRWDSINPAADIHYLPQVRRAQIGWFRLRLRVGPSLRQKTLALVIGQIGASELYLNGRLIQRFGVVSSDPTQEQTYNPKNRPISVVLGGQPEQVLAVRYSFTRQNPYIKYNWLAGSRCFSAWLTDVESAWGWFVGWHDFVIPPMALYGGLFLMLTLLHGFFYATYPTQKANGYFALYAFFQCLNIAGDASFLVTHSAGWVFAGSALNLVSSLISLACMLQAVYHFFNQRISTGFFLAIGGGLLVSALLPFLAYERGWGIGIYCSLLLINLDILRVSWVALRQHQPDARLLFWGQVIVLFAYWPTLPKTIAPESALQQALAAYLLPYYSTLFPIWVLTLPVTVSFALARQFARLNKTLAKKLAEVEELSQKNLAQEAEKQQLLISQNETLERQVAERTTELSHQAEALRTARDQLKAVNQQKERFFGNIAHEFRTPLTLILTPIEKLLHQGRTDDPARRLLAMVQRNAGQLLALVNQLLDLAKLEDGRLVAAPTRGDLAGFVGERIESFRELANSRRLTLRFVAKGLPEATVFDAEKVGKIVDNLLSNALKFTPSDGDVTVDLHWIADRSSAVLRVVDTGIGIPTDKLPHIFDRFYQADTSRTRAYEGTGIGLALAKELTDWLGGTLTVESEEGRGTTFTVELPIQPAQGHEPLLLPQSGPIVLPAWQEVAAPPADLPANDLPNDETRPLLLVVEDNDELRDFLAESLADTFRVLTAVNGREGLFIAQRDLPDVVVSDVMMPGMDGYQLCRHLKTDARTDHIAVLLLTARSAHESRIEGLSQGADDYLTKPFHADELHLRLRNLLTRRAQLQAYFQRQLAQPAADTTDLLLVSDPPGSTHPFLEKLYAFVEERLDDSTFKAEDLASAVSMTRRTLHRKLVALVGLPPQEIIRQYRLRRATDLLRAGRNVSETAYLIGYDSPAHFTTIFKEFYGQTPSEFVH